MGLAQEKCDRVFLLFVRCTNCLADSTQHLMIPNVADTPRDTDELLESAALASMKFRCERCEGSIGELIGIGGGELL